METRYVVSIAVDPSPRSHASVLAVSAADAISLARSATGQDDSEKDENVEIGAESVVYRGKGVVAVVTPIGAPRGSQRPAIPLPAAPSSPSRRPRRPRKGGASK